MNISCKDNENFEFERSSEKVRVKNILALTTIFITREKSNFFTGSFIIT